MVLVPHWWGCPRKVSAPPSGSACLQGQEVREGKSRKSPTDDFAQNCPPHLCLTLVGPVGCHARPWEGRSDQVGLFYLISLGRVACLFSTSVIQFSEIPLLGISTAGFNSHAFLYAFHYVPTIFPFPRALDPNFKEKLFLFCLTLSNAICS